jgi:hypothetical protein
MDIFSHPLKVSGAQWEAEDITAMLRLYCADLNGELTFEMSIYIRPKGEFSWSRSAMSNLSNT